MFFGQIDRYFKGGAFTKKWYPVPSNAKVKIFLQYFKGWESFEYDSTSNDKILNTLDKEGFCKLEVVGKELLDLTKVLKPKVTTIEGEVSKFSWNSKNWEISISGEKDETCISENVIFCPGQTPISLPYNNDIEIPLEIGLNFNILKLLVEERKIKTIAIYGSSHSSMLVIKNAYEAGVEKIINFYREPIKHAEYMDGWIRWDNTGLKGDCSEWVKEYIEGDKKAKNIFRYDNSDPSFNDRQYLKGIDAVCYTIGFSRKNYPQLVINGNNVDSNKMYNNYNPHTCEISQNMIGMGIGFPEKVTSPEGDTSFNVGLLDFIKTANVVLLKNPVKPLSNSLYIKD